MLQDSKEYVNTVEQVVKSLEDGLCSKVVHFSIPVQSTDYTLPWSICIPAMLFHEAIMEIFRYVYKSDRVAQLMKTAGWSD